VKNLLLTGFIVLIGCSSPSSPVTNTTNITATSTRTILNSLWQVVPSNTVSSYSRSLARDVGIVNLDASVALYNASHTDDQWFIVDGQIPGIDQAPPCDIFIVDPITHDVLTDTAGNLMEHTNWPRAQLVSNYAGWVTDANAAAGVLYIDVIPPAPTPPTADQAYAAKQVYVINNVGAIKYHYDCSVVPSAWLPDTPTQYFSTMLSEANLICQSDGVGQPDSPWTVVSGQVYTAP
jgi:hypothetical protein